MEEESCVERSCLDHALQSFELVVLALVFVRQSFPFMLQSVKWSCFMNEDDDAVSGARCIENIGLK